MRKAFLGHVVNDSEPGLTIFIFPSHVIPIPILFFLMNIFHMILYLENEEHLLKKREWPSEIAK